MLALRMLPPNDAWLLVFFALVLTAVFILLSVTLVEMVRIWPNSRRLLAQWHHGVRILSAPIQAKGAVSAPHANRKHLLQGVQRVAAHGVEPLHLRFVQFMRPVHVIRLQVHVDGPDHAWDRVSDLGIRCLQVQQLRLDAQYMQTKCTLDAETGALFARLMQTMHTLLCRQNAHLMQTLTHYMHTQ
jgi:hypothetical protein